MKKQIKMILVMGLLAGCSRKQPVSSITPEETPEVKETIWTVEPTLDFESVKDFQDVTNRFLTVSTSGFGEIQVPVILETTSEEISGIIAEKDNLQGIYDFRGNEIQPIQYNTVSSPARIGITSGYQDGTMYYGIVNTSNSTATVFSQDLKTASESDHFVTDYYDNDNASPYFAVQNGTFGVVVMSRDGSGKRTGWVFEAVNSSVLPGRAIIQNVDGVCNVINQVVYNPASGVVSDVASGAPLRTHSFANGYYVIAEGNHATLVNADYATGVAVDYGNVGFFSDGYAPAMRNGKWGFVDGSGYEVTDFMFDDVSGLHDGNAYVEWNGKYGVLDVAGLLKEGKQINFSSIAESDEKIVGDVSVHVSGLIVHDVPQTGTGTIGTCMNGSKYPVYEIKADETYMWYRISDVAWIADNGEWCTFVEK